MSAFSRDNAPATMTAVLSYEPPPLRSLCPGASEGLEAIVHKALSKEPAGRPSTAQEMAARLHEQAGAEFSNHGNIVNYLRTLGMDLQGPAPEPLLTEPQIVKRARLRKPAPERQQKSSVAVPVSNLEGQAIANGRYRLIKLLSQTRMQGTHLAWKQHFLAEDSERPGEDQQVVVTVCGGLEPGNGLSQREALRMYQYLAHRSGPNPSPHLPPVLDHGQIWAEGPIYLVTPYHSLRLSQVPDGALSPAEALQITAHIARAVLAEQKRDPAYVHGDIRPENIALENQSLGRRQALLLDFSLGSVLQLPLPPALSREQAEYAPAEHGEETKVSPAFDVFSLGMVFYRLCGGDVSAVKHCLQEEKELPPLPAVAQSALKPDILAVLFDSLRSDPGMRPSMAELRAILETELVRTTPTMGQPIVVVEEAPVKSAMLSSTLDPPRALLRLSERLTSQTLPFGRSGRIHVQSLCLNSRDLREPVSLPLDLDGLLPGNKYPLMIGFAVNLMELRVSAQAFQAGRTVRIYPEVTAAAARNSYALPAEFSEKQLFIGHHRGLLHTVYLSRRSGRPPDSPLRIALPRLELDLEVPGAPSDLLTLWRAAPQSAEVYLVTVILKDK